MSDRDNRVWAYLTDEELATLESWADDAGKSKSHLLREAILEYLDHDRTARLEARVDDLDAKLDTVLARLDTADTHTHMDHDPVQQGSPATEKMRAMLDRIREHHAPIVKASALDRVIEDYAGVDDRTKSKYKSLMRERGLLLEHPGSTAVWTTDSDQWTDWLADYGNLNGKPAVEDFLDDYPARVIPADQGSLTFDVSDIGVVADE